MDALRGRASTALAVWKRSRQSTSLAASRVVCSASVGADAVASFFSAAVFSNAGEQARERGLAELQRVEHVLVLVAQRAGRVDLGLRLLDERVAARRDEAGELPLEVASRSATGVREDRRRAASPCRWDAVATASTCSM